MSDWQSRQCLASAKICQIICRADVNIINIIEKRRKTTQVPNTIGVMFPQ